MVVKIKLGKIKLVGELVNKKIGILGIGSWGTALGVLLSKKGQEVEMWGRDKVHIEDMIINRENKKYLPNIDLPENMSLSYDLEQAIYGKDIILLAIPTHGVRETLKLSRPYINDRQIIVNVAKGIENGTLMRISEIVEEILPENEYSMLSGPSHAEEVAIELPTTVVSASKSKRVAEIIQDVFMTPNFRVYTNPDIIGVELGGALKNIIALSAGISDGLKYGDNSKAALMTRGIFEISRLGEKMGARATTFSGLSGIGDLIVTCTSMHSRNRRAGILIGEGKSVEEAIREIGMVVEGIKTTKSTYELAKNNNIDMPITNELYRVLYGEKDVKYSVMNLMGRDKKHEMENIVLDNNYNW